MKIFVTDRMSMGKPCGLSTAMDDLHYFYVRQMFKSWLDVPELGGQIRRVMQLSPWMRRFKNPEHVLQQVLQQPPSELQFFSSLRGSDGADFTTVNVKCKCALHVADKAIYCRKRSMPSISLLGFVKGPVVAVAQLW